MSEQAEGQWIAVEDERPKSGEIVLCQLRGGRFVCTSWEAFCDQNEAWFIDRFIAWQPLPTPYQREEQS